MNDELEDLDRELECYLAEIDEIMVHKLCSEDEAVEIYFKRREENETN